MESGHDHESTESHYTGSSKKENHRPAGVDLLDQKNKTLRRRLLIGAGTLLATGGVLTAGFLGLKGNGSPEAHATAKPRVSASVEATPSPLAPDARLANFTADTLPTLPDHRGLLLSREGTLTPDQFVSDATMQQAYAGNISGLSHVADTIDRNLSTYESNYAKGVAGADLALAAYDNAEDPILNSLLTHSANGVKFTYRDTHDIGDSPLTVKRDDQKLPTAKAYANQKEFAILISTATPLAVVFKDVMVPGKGHLLVPESGYAPTDMTAPFQDMPQIVEGSPHLGPPDKNPAYNNILIRYHGQVLADLEEPDRVRALYESNNIASLHLVSDQVMQNTFNKDVPSTDKAIAAAMASWKYAMESGANYNQTIPNGDRAYAYYLYSKNIISNTETMIAIARQQTQGDTSPYAAAALIASTINVKRSADNTAITRVYPKEKELAFLVDTGELGDDGRPTKVAVFKDVVVPKYGHILVIKDLYAPSDLSAPFTELTYTNTQLESGS
jgi:hypothetical protein